MNIVLVCVAVPTGRNARAIDEMPRVSSRKRALFKGPAVQHPRNYVCAYVYRCVRVYMCVCMCSVYEFNANIVSARGGGGESMTGAKGGKKNKITKYNYKGKF